jgi:hypothetical protein
MGHGNGSGHIDPNMLCAPRSGSFLSGNPTKLATGDASVTFYTNHMQPKNENKSDKPEH